MLISYSSLACVYYTHNSTSDTEQSAHSNAEGTDKQLDEKAKSEQQK